MWGKVELCDFEVRTGETHCSGAASASCVAHKRMPVFYVKLSPKGPNLRLQWSNKIHVYVPPW